MAFIDYYKILGLEQNSTEKQIKEAYFKLAKKHHPDFSESPDIDLLENIKMMNDKFFKTERAFKRSLTELFIIGDLDENELVNLRQILKILTYFILADSISIVFIFYKIIGGRRIFFALIFALATMIIHGFCVFFYIDYLFYQKMLVFTQFCDFLVSSIFCEMFMMSTACEIVYLFGLIQVAVFYCLSSLIGVFNSQQNDYYSLFSSLLRKTQELKITQARRTDAQIKGLKEIIEDINKILGRGNKIWKWIQNIFFVLSLFLMFKQGF